MPRHGICEVCGTKVDHCASSVNPVNGWVAGHLYEGGKLVSVRCFEHRKEGDTRVMLLGELLKKSYIPL